MFSQINNPADVIAFAKLLIEEGITIHPDSDFNDYVNIKTHKPSYTNADAQLRNELMNQCFAVCKVHGIDIYDCMGEVELKETGLDQFIPFPSQAFSE
jgi:hypothetical protein